MISGDPTSVVTVVDAKADTRFQHECLELLSPYYSNPEIPLRYAFDHESTHIYFSRCEDGELAAVFFGRIPEHVLKDLPPIGYMGLTGGYQQRPTPGPPPLEDVFGAVTREGE